jgi:hypothetical protein
MKTTMIWLGAVPVVLVAVAAGHPAAAEQERVDGMGRTRGWVVATDEGDLGFVDCQGRQSPLGNARIESSTTRCPTSPTPLDVTGVVRSVDAVRRIVHAQDDAGRVRVFHITDEVPRLEALKPGARIRATGPIDGQATGMTSP